MTTVAVSRETIALLEPLKKSFNASSLDECIRMLATAERGKDSMFGVDKGRIDTKNLRLEDDHRF